MENKYDSTQDTRDHILNVAKFLAEIQIQIDIRIMNHDNSKLEEPEKSMYDEFTPKLQGLTYGSDEYKATLKEMGKALEHHYQVNSHHPEHYENGLHDMSLLDIIEMLADWKAASLRHNNGSISKSIEINRKRFNIEDQLCNILLNTIEELEW